MTRYKIFYLLISVFFWACSSDVPMVNLGIDDVYYIYRMQKLGLYPAFTGERYQWTLIADDGTEMLLSDQRDYIFLSEHEGSYHLAFDIFDATTPYHFDFVVHVIHEDVEYSPYTAKVYEYCPAPGQFVNTMPLYESGDDNEAMRQKAEDDLKNDVMITLGAYGGYVTFGFDHMVVNVPGQKDFLIKGNAFYSDLPAYEQQKGGSAEPGIVEVSYDVNLNGIPDDPWYELAGSEYYKPTTIKNYQIVYSRPDNTRKPDPDPSGTFIDTKYIPWRDNQGETGYIAKNTFHKQDYYPAWLDADELHFKGTLLPKNGRDESGIGTYYILYAFDWGYVDNHPNQYEDLNSFDIDWAVDDMGNYVHLPGVDFIRVYTGMNQYCGWLGESSTEVARAQDLHIAVLNNVPDDPIPGEQ